MPGSAAKAGVQGARHHRGTDLPSGSGSTLRKRSLVVFNALFLTGALNTGPGDRAMSSRWVPNGFDRQRS